MSWSEGVEDRLRSFANYIDVRENQSDIYVFTRRVNASLFETISQALRELGAMMIRPGHFEGGQGGVWKIPKPAHKLRGLQGEIVLLPSEAEI